MVLLSSWNESSAPRKIKRRIEDDTILPPSDPKLGENRDDRPEIPSLEIIWTAAQKAQKAIKIARSGGVSGEGRAT